ncbi:MAG TPA: hypothetical protein VK154_14025 [Chitinophagales bacterium]|nr:hypothetical protein [Chitinophagales bacterium]
MKKLVFASVAALALSFSISSCSKCQVCTKDSEPETRICKSDYNSETAYGLAVDTKEAMGFECKSSL